MNKMDVMIPRTVSGVHAVSWQKALADAITDAETLLQVTGNNPALVKERFCIPDDFPIRVPYPYARRINRGDIEDPLLRQVLSYREETYSVPGYTEDPLHESASNPTSGIIHKYQGRVLLVLSGACAINCRYCFRRFFDYQGNRNSTEKWSRALDYVRNNPEISEVIYSGGDPLVNSDSKLAQLTRQIAEIDHVRRLRIHTRMPVVIPQRVTDELLGWLTETRLKVSMVLHVNHANELGEDAGRALTRLSTHRIQLLNQSVLLKGVNDSADTLAQLSEALFSYGVLPYYLHLMDKVQHAAHYDIDLQTAREIEYQMRAQLPGYLLPRLVREIPGRNSKTPIDTLA